MILPLARFLCLHPGAPGALTLGEDSGVCVQVEISGFKGAQDPDISGKELLGLPPPRCPAILANGDGKSVRSAACKAVCLLRPGEVSGELGKRDQRGPV